MPTEEKRASNNMVRRRGTGIEQSHDGWWMVCKDACSSELFSHCTADGATPAASAANQETEEDTAEETDRCQREKGACRERSRELWMEMRVKLWGIVESKYFNRGIMVAILINTISMGIEHHEQVTHIHTLVFM